MTARDEAIEALSDIIWHQAISYIPLGDAGRIAERAVNTIPPNVLVRLAIEQGALEPMEWVDIVDPDVPLYRVVGP